MILKINDVDMIPYIIQNGIKWNLVDAKGAGNEFSTMDGTTYRNRVASKVRLTITCLPLKSEDAEVVLNAIYPEYVTVEYMDPMYGHSIKTMFCANIPATYINTTTDLWEGIAFTLIER